MRLNKIIVPLVLLCMVSLSMQIKDTKAKTLLPRAQVIQEGSIYKEKKNVYKVIELLDVINQGKNDEKRIFKISKNGKFGLMLSEVNYLADGSESDIVKIIEKPKYFNLYKTEQAFYYKVRNTGGYGIIRAKDPNNIMTVVPVQFEDVSVFPDEVYKVRKKGKYGLYQAGTFALPPEYNSIDLLTKKPHKYNYYKIINDKRKVGIYSISSHKSKIAAEPVYDDVQLFYENPGFHNGSTFKVISNGKYGLISVKDFNMKKELDFLYDDIELLSGKGNKQFAKLIVQGKVVVVCIYPEEEHKIVIISESEFDDIQLLENDDDIYCKFRLHRKYGLMHIDEKLSDTNTKYKILLQPIYDDILYDKKLNDHLLFGLYLDGLYGFYNRAFGDLVAPLYNYEIIGQTENLLKIKKDNKIVLMDPKQNIVYDFDEFRKLNVNTYSTRSGDKWGVLNEKGNIPPLYDRVVREIPITNSVSNYVISIDGKLGLVNDKNEFIIYPKKEYQDIQIENGIIYYLKDNQWTIYEKTDMLIPKKGIVGK